MKKKAFLLLMIFIMVLTQGFTLNTYGYTSIVRVGLTTNFYGLSSVDIGGQSLTAGYSTGSSFYDIGYFDFSQGAQASKSYAYYIAVGGSFSDFDSAKAYSLGLTGYSSVPAYKGNGIWNVYIGPYESRERAQAASQNYPYDALVCVPGVYTVSVSAVSGDSFIYDYSGGYFAVAGDSYTKIGSSSYRGYIEFYPEGSGFTAVNVVSLETYLCGVVPSEVPGEWNEEALKAQAVAARTYILNRLESGTGESAGYDICDNAHCQMYTGTASEAASTTAAVNATAGQAITYEGQLINAVYSSSAGGVTDDNVNVWGNDLPYLKSVQEIEGTEVVEWERTYTFSELTSLLAANGAGIGQLVYVSLERSGNGRVYSMTFSGNQGTYTIEKENVRTFFNSSSQGSLMSRVFDISFIYNDNSSEFTLEIKGKGWGHGVGLSQYGAKSMAEAGYTYEEILKHYYTGVEIVNY
ncbi:MAG: SpoIID/LytB domain-containing protein [Clostridiales bacterium]|nr:SpoIID/LytB domain-containing protein [Clostridiales bacterium]